MDDLKHAILAASTRSDLRAAVESLYTDLSKEIATRQPRCDASGRCCHFEAFGHRLYVTTAELATFLHALQHREQPAPVPQATPPTRLPVLSPQSAVNNPQSLPPDCPFQVENLCSVHPIRPFGCRIFFCDPTATQWQQDRYEHFHQQLKSLHARFDVPYYYVEWRAALRALGLLP